MAAKATKKPAKKAASKKTSAKKSPDKKTTAKKSAAESAAKSASKKPAAKAASGVRSNQVVLAHLFALKPRVAMAFKPDDFRQAKQLLEDESYESVPEAARAVAERALELTRKGIPRRQKRR